ncbi:MAG: HAMP domain-containing sensor histidine kinase [Myxococcota bacterium]
MDEEISVDDAALRRMCHLFSHDLRNPLAAIVTNLEFARRMLDGVDEDLAEAVTDSVIACEVLRRIVANFELISSPEPTAASPEDLVIEDLLLEVVNKCRDQAAQAELTVDTSALEGRTVVRADKPRLQLALENMIANSLQHAPPRTDIRLTVAPGEGHHIDVLVEDDGPAVDEAIRAKASAPAMHTMKTRQPGMRYSRGLGLLAGRLAAQSQGASMLIDEAKGRHRLVLSLPLATPLNAE